MRATWSTQFCRSIPSVCSTLEDAISLCCSELVVLCPQYTIHQYSLYYGTGSHSLSSQQSPVSTYFDIQSDLFALRYNPTYNLSSDIHEYFWSIDSNFTHLLVIIQCCCCCCSCFSPWFHAHLLHWISGILSKWDLSFWN